MLQTVRLTRNFSPDLWNRLLAIAEKEVDCILGKVPAHLREAAQGVTLVYESRPNRSLIHDGIEADTLGLFVGDAFADAEQSASVVPPEIILFLENIWDVAEENEVNFRDEIRATYLHELGHYLGLDEDDLADRGLE